MRFKDSVWEVCGLVCFRFYKVGWLVLKLKGIGCCLKWVLLLRVGVVRYLVLIFLVLVSISFIKVKVVGVGLWFIEYLGEVVGSWVIFKLIVGEI